jgi:hypothetical protein
LSRASDHGTEIESVVQRGWNWSNAMFQPLSEEIEKAEGSRLREQLVRFTGIGTISAVLFGGLLLLVLALE